MKRNLDLQPVSMMSIQPYPCSQVYIKLDKEKFPSTMRSFPGTKCVNSHALIKKKNCLKRFRTHRKRSVCWIQTMGDLNRIRPGNYTLISLTGPDMPPRC